MITAPAFQGKSKNRKKLRSQPAGKNKDSVRRITKQQFVSAVLDARPGAGVYIFS
jgi:hypothetical protein